MSRKGRRCLWTVGLAFLLSFWLPSNLKAASTAVGCNGRCTADFYEQPRCSLSLFGQNMCLQGIDYCAEFACPFSEGPGGLASADMGTAPISLIDSSTPASGESVATSRPATEIQIREHKARS